MAEISIAEMNASHYKMLQTDPIYRLDYAMDIYREEMSCYEPRWDDGYEERKLAEIDKAEPEWARKQWGYVQQLKAEMKYLENKLNEHINDTLGEEGNSF